MQTLKEVFQREDERINLKNMALCTSIVVLLVFLAFGFRDMQVSVQQSAPPTPAPVTADGSMVN
jgi:hypothetical protein